MKRSIFAIGLISSMGLTYCNAMAQNSPFFTELRLGAGTVVSRATSHYDMGDYCYPTDVDETGRINENFGYAAELKWQASAQWVIGHHLLKKFSAFLSFEFALPHYEFTKTKYWMRSAPGSSKSSSEFELNSSSYLFSPAIGFRLPLFGAANVLYLEWYAGQTYRHIDLRWSPEFPQGVRYYFDPYIRDRSRKTFLGTGFAYHRSLSERIGIDAAIRWTSLREDRGSLFFLDSEWGQCQSVTGSVGISHTF